MGSEMTEKPESKRGRVRRLLIEPLTELGFRKSGKVTADRHKANIASLADELAYMSDDSLTSLYAMLRTKGQGGQRDIWPSTATMVGFAELVQERPLEELPGLVRWFASVEGPKALHDGTLVETWLYFHKHKKPPFSAQHIIREKADANRRKLALYRDRAKRNVADESELDWVRRYEARLTYCTDLVQGKTSEDAG